MLSYDFTRQAEREFSKLPHTVQKQILHKLEHYISQPNPLLLAKRIYGGPINCYRFESGDYRIIFDWEETRILVTKVGHRKDVYRG